jgi:hypothetical protein
MILTSVLILYIKKWGMCLYQRKGNQMQDTTIKVTRIVWAVRANNGDSGAPSWKWTGASSSERLVQLLGDIRRIGEPILVEVFQVENFWRIPLPGGEFNITLLD